MIEQVLLGTFILPSPVLGWGRGTYKGGGLQVSFNFAGTPILASNQRSKMIGCYGVRPRVGEGYVKKGGWLQIRVAFDTSRDTE